MKRAIFFMLSLVLSLSMGFAQGKPTIAFEKNTHDFGEILEANGDVSYKFIVKNTGKTPLVISRVTASCGCTTPDWTKEPIAPGKTGFVKATYSTKGRIGPFSKTITVYSNEESGSSVLTIKGEVLKDKPKVEDTHPIAMGGLRLKTKSVDFNWVKNTESKTENIEFVNTGKTPVTLTFDKLPKYLSIATGSVAIQPDQKGTIAITYKGALVKDYGVQNAQFCIVVNKDKKNASQNVIDVKAKVIDDFSKITYEQKQNAPRYNVSTTNLTFDVSVPSQLTQTLKIANSGKSNLAVRSIKATSNTIVISGSKKEILPGDMAEYKVTVQPSKLTAGGMYLINIVTNDPDNFMKEVQVNILKK